MAPSVLGQLLAKDREMNFAYRLNLLAVVDDG